MGIAETNISLQLEILDVLHHGLIPRSVGQPAVSAIPFAIKRYWREGNDHAENLAASCKVCFRVEIIRNSKYQTQMVFWRVPISKRLSNSLLKWGKFISSSVDLDEN